MSAALTPDSDETTSVMRPNGGPSRRVSSAAPIPSPDTSPPSAQRPDSDPAKSFALPTADLPGRPTVVPEHSANDAPHTHHGSALLLWDPLLDTLASGLDDIENVRIAQANRFRILTTVEPDSDGEIRGFGLDLNHPSVAALEAQLTTLKALEHGMVLALQRQLRTHPLHPWIKAQKGLGDKQVARLLASIQDPYWNNLHDRPRTVSELWAFCGLHVLAVGHATSGTQSAHADGNSLPASHTGAVAHTRPAGGELLGRTDHPSPDAQKTPVGVAPARRRGQKANWNTTARTRIYVIAESCMKNRQSPYRAVYDDGRAKYADSVHAAPCAQCGKKGQPAGIGTELRDGHKHARAMRLVMKAVLRDLWVESKRIHQETNHA